jgi:hypothetical protein
MLTAGDVPSGHAGALVCFAALTAGDVPSGRRAWLELLTAGDVLSGQLLGCACRGADGRGCTLGAPRLLDGVLTA